MLADYIIALLKHDKPLDELKGVCILQLKDFMSDGQVVPFVDLLFARLNRQHQDRDRSRSPLGMDHDQDDIEKRLGDRRDRDHSRRRPDHRDQRDDRRDDRRGRQERPRRHRNDSHDRFEKDEEGPNTLVVRGIPSDKCNLPSIMEFFSRFGTITNIKVDSKQSRAVLQYEYRSEANAAYNSPDVIFDNRFVKVFWLEKESDDIAVPDDPVARRAEREQVIKEHNIIAQEKLRQLRAEKQEKAMQVQKGRAMLIERQLEEQKRLMAQLDDPNLDGEQKVTLMNGMKLIEESIRSMIASAPQAGAAPQPPQQMEVDPGLQDQLSALQQRAASLGVGKSRGARGRGRGNAAQFTFNPNAASFKLDNRSSAFSITPFDRQLAEQTLAHYQAMPGFISFTAIPQGALVQFMTRKQAEMVHYFYTGNHETAREQYQCN